MDQIFDDDIDIFLCSNQPPFSAKPVIHNVSLHSSISKQPQEKLQTSCYAGSFSNSRRNPKNCKSVREKGRKKSEVRSKRGGSIIEKDKKERNRVAAKESRDRKKLYIQLMEKEQKKLENEIELVEAQIQQTKNKINLFFSENKSATGFTCLNQLQPKLEQLLLKDFSSTIQEQINIILDSIMFRVGATGKERIMKINECFKQIINLSLPALHRYVLWMASEKKHWFDEEGNERQVKDAFQEEMMKIGENNQEGKELFIKIRPLIQQKKQALINLIRKLREIRNNIYNQSKSLQDDIVSLRQTLTAVQAASFTVNIGKNKFRKEINFLQMSDRCMDEWLEEKVGKGVKQEEG